MYFVCIYYLMNILQRDQISIPVISIALAFHMRMISNFYK